MPELWTTDQIVAQLLKSLALVTPWGTDHLTFSFSQTVTPDVSGLPLGEGFSPFTPEQAAAVRQVLAAYSEVIPFTFDEVTDDQGNTGDLRFANYQRAPGESYGFFPGPGLGGDVFVSTAPGPAGWVDPAFPTPGNGPYLALLHEIGHAMGLGHPGDYDGGAPTWARDALFAQDTQQYTVMSYFLAQAYTNGNDHFDPQGVLHFPQTLMLYDIAALQQVYGANTATRADATVYGFHSTLGPGSPYDFAGNPYPVLCIYDAGGRDRIDFSGFSGATRINLAEGSFSSTQDLSQNIAIAFGTVIEDATGGAGSDILKGNQARNDLRGGAGSDQLFGFAGRDTLLGGQGNDTLDGGGGADVLTGGAGRDGFVLGFKPASAAEADVVKDFNHAADHFRVSSAAFAEVGKWTAGKFFASASGLAHDLSDRFILETDTGRLFFDPDGNAAGGADGVLVARLANLAFVDWTDFVLV